MLSHHNSEAFLTETSDKITNGRLASTIRMKSDTELDASPDEASSSKSMKMLTLFTKKAN